MGYALESPSSNASRIHNSHSLHGKFIIKIILQIPSGFIANKLGLNNGFIITKKERKIRKISLRLQCM